jgi:hypothetical protein
MSAHIVAFPGPQCGSAADPLNANDPMLDLARQIVHLTANVRPMIAASFEADARASGEILRRLGVSRDELKAQLEKSGPGGEHYDRWWKTSCEVYKELGTHDTNELIYKLDGRRDAVFERMMALPIHTLSDAALLYSSALLVGAINDDLWGEALRDLDWDKQTLRRLIEKIMVAGGGKPPDERRRARP